MHMNDALRTLGSTRENMTAAAYPEELVMQVEDRSKNFDEEDNNIEKEKEKEIANKALPFSKLMSYADVVDWILMALGTLGSVVHGMAQPIGYLLLGKALDAFGTNIGNNKATVKAIKQVPTISPSIYKYIHTSLATTKSFNVLDFRYVYN